MILTYKYRVRDRRSAKFLVEKAAAVNQCWNWMAGYQRHILDRYTSGKPSERWPSKFDLEKLLKGSAHELEIPSDTINRLCGQFVANRGKRARPLKFRASFGTKRALGWIPFKGRFRQFDGGTMEFRGRKIRWFGDKRRPLPGPVKTGAFVEDALGRWWITLQVEVAAQQAPASGRIGIDLGLATLATCSDGTKVANVRPIRPWAEKLAVAQRAGNRRRAKAIHAKIANIRKDHLHKASRSLVRANGFIAVGDVNAGKLAKTRMAKSVFDASWSALRHMLQYKSQQAGGVFVEVNEAWTSRTCSSCGAIPDSSPKGRSALGIRAWICDACGAVHDRDVNAAQNILRLGKSAVAREDEIRRAA